MKTNLVLILSLLLAFGACSKKKGKVPSTGPQETKNVDGAQDNPENANADGAGKSGPESNDLDKNYDDSSDSENKDASIEKRDNPGQTSTLGNTPSVDDATDVTTDGTTDPSILDQTVYSDVILFTDDGEAFVNPGVEAQWLSKYAQSSNVKAVVVDGYDDTKEYSELLVVRTNTTPEKIELEMKANKLLKKLKMTFHEYVDYLTWKSNDCDEAINSIMDFAEKYSFQINKHHFTYDSKCNCSKIKKEHKFDVLEVLRTQRANGWECPDNYITFKTCMDYTGDMKKYDTLTLNFSKAAELSEGEYEVYRVQLEQKRLGSKKLIFKVTPLINSRGESLESLYETKYKGLSKNKDKININTIND